MATGVVEVVEDGTTVVVVDEGELTFTTCRQPASRMQQATPNKATAQTLLKPVFKRPPKQLERLLRVNCFKTPLQKPEACKALQINAIIIGGKHKTLLKGNGSGNCG
jgi:hypothetical protein